MTGRRIGYFLDKPHAELIESCDRLHGDHSDCIPKIWKRPGLQAAVRELAQGDTLVVYSQAVLHPHNHVLAHALHRQGKSLESLHGTLTLGQDVLAIDEMVDSGRSGTRQAVTRRGGRQGGPAPYGFLADGDAYAWDASYKGQTLIMAMKLRQTGMTYEQVADRLNANSLPAPRGGKWTHSTVRRVIKQAQRLTHLIPADAVFGGR